MKTNMMMIALLLVISAETEAQAERPPVSVVVETVERMNVSPTVPVTGTVYSRDDVQITLGVDGQLEFVAEPGTRVKQGDVIARIDTTPLELDRAEQQAQAERARAQLRYLDAQLRRQQDLADTNVLAASELEETQSQRDVAASDLRIAEVRLKQIDDQLRRAVVKADFDGVITNRLRREGEDVTRGTAIARLLDTERLEVRVLVPLRYHGRVTIGDRLRLFGFEREAIGRVRSIVPTPEPRQQAFEMLVEITVGNENSAASSWSVGELVSVAVPLSSASEVLVVPRDALILRQDGNYVFRVSNDNTAEKIPVTIGDSAGDRIAVSGDLRAGDRVVVRGGESLVAGQAVNILQSSQSVVAARVERMRTG